MRLDDCLIKTKFEYRDCTLMSDYKFVVFERTDWNKTWNEDQHKSYDTFSKVWTQTYREIHGPQYQFFSDDFTRQDFIEVLFVDGECAALDCIRNVNLHAPSAPADSWFRSWNKKHLETLKIQGVSLCSINSYFTVHPDHRKSAQPGTLHPSYILGCLSVLNQLERKIPVMLGMMRNNRSMDQLGLALGSQAIEKNVLHNNLPTDLVAFHQDSVKKASKTFPALVFDLFKNRLDHQSSRRDHERAA
jgi:hypothetical protein